MKKLPFSFSSISSSFSFSSFSSLSLILSPSFLLSRSLSAFLPHLLPFSFSLSLPSILSLSFFPFSYFYPFSLPLLSLLGFSPSLSFRSDSIHFAPFSSFCSFFSLSCFPRLSSLPFSYAVFLLLSFRSRGVRRLASQQLHLPIRSVSEINNKQ